MLFVVTAADMQMKLNDLGSQLEDMTHDMKRETLDATKDLLGT